MSVPEFMPTTFEGKIARLIEECSEVSKEAVKILRFGDRSWGGGPTNGELLEAEMQDLIEQIAIVREAFATTTPNERKRKVCP